MNTAEGVKKIAIGPEPQNGLLYCYEGTNITGKKVVNPPRMKLNDALIES